MRWITSITDFEYIEFARQQSYEFNRELTLLEQDNIDSICYITINNMFDFHFDIYPIKMCPDGTRSLLWFINNTDKLDIDKRKCLYTLHNNNVINKFIKEDLIAIFQQEGNPTKQYIPKDWLLRWL